MIIHKEIAFEDEICEYLGANGWIYVEGDASRYDRTRALSPDDVLAWVQSTQPAAWEALEKNHSSGAGETLLNRLRDSLDQRGSLDVLRHGIDLLGLKGKLPLAQFKPALAINPDIQARYAQNRLRRSGGQPAAPQRRPQGISLGRGLAAGQLAGNPRPLHGRRTRRQAAAEGLSVSAVPLARRHPPAAGRGA